MVPSYALWRIQGWSIRQPRRKEPSHRFRLTERAVEALRSHLERQLAEIEALGDLYKDQGLVFTTEAGTPINPSNLRQRSLVSLLKRVGLPQITFHDLRHTCASLLFQKNVHRAGFLRLFWIGEEHAGVNQFVARSGRRH